MPEYAPGTPSWVDLGTPDLGASVSFYETLFGWSIPEGPNSEQNGGYRQAMRDGKPVAGVMPLMAEGQPPAWSSYVSVADAGATAPSQPISALVGSGVVPNSGSRSEPAWQRGQPASAPSSTR